MSDTNKDPNASQRVDILSRTIVALLIGILIGAVISLTGLSALEDHVMEMIIGFVVLVVLISALSFVFGFKQGKSAAKTFRRFGYRLVRRKGSRAALVPKCLEPAIPGSKRSF